MYYKIVDNGHVIDANYIFLAWRSDSMRLLMCEQSDAEFILSSDGRYVYTADWLKPVPASCNVSYRQVECYIISENEYTEIRNGISHLVIEDTSTIDDSDTNNELLSIPALFEEIHQLKQIVNQLITSE